MALAKEFDVFHFYFGESLSGSRLVDVRWLQRAGKQVFFYFCGCDIRDSKLVIDRHPISACAECWPMGCSANRDAAAEVANSADGVFVSTPDLFEFMPQATLLPQPLDLVRFGALRATAQATKIARDEDVIRIAHAPSNRTIKGTKYVEAAIEELRQRGRHVELVLVEGVSYTDSLAIYNSCDIAVDQMLIGAYGQFAVETMALGKPTVCFIRDDVSALYPAGLPIVSAEPTELADVLDDLIDRRDDWAALGARGVEFVERVHGSLNVAQIALDAYKTPVGRPR
jgi:glycosyltransferase involved in cell wall biosynthesis